jgi:short-subunit dehydrogenase
MSNKLAIVTGGTKGIGRAIIELLAAKGFDIATCARTYEQLLSLKQTLTAQYGIKVHTFVADLSDEIQVRDFCHFANSLGAPDLLVCNAALYQTGRITEEEKPLLPRLLSANVLSNYHLCRAVVPSMKVRKSGHIFTICSVASVMPKPDIGSYAVSKAAVYSLTQNLREELKHFGIKVTAILPGATLTASWDDEPNKPDNILSAKDVADSLWAAYNLSANACPDEIRLSPLNF